MLRECLPVVSSWSRGFSLCSMLNIRPFSPLRHLAPSLGGRVLFAAACASGIVDGMEKKTVAIKRPSYLATASGGMGLSRSECRSVLGVGQLTDTSSGSLEVWRPVRSDQSYGIRLPLVHSRRPKSEQPPACHFIFTMSSSLLICYSR
ncbi:uncharacterized protein BP01DRAFT_31326 [Aspergillus saccharolyticus JOP 1030-1]|uniref:Uncharacterized protein n=1 Tax=Aspergillus saccharolyticus JOP 1030-1 TaxID=1450539 RepID=A0A318ZEA9_9EURO|nr:hypothetical protein BP01DRAFT_31326 [Aspergillus saccharolyticus JOP 1030-1]PYH45871.1 hypothetical protein BP01DRAFT_31326 [Aspergillus saccharolyticus JOP 1030-1]